MQPGSQPAGRLLAHLDGNVRVDKRNASQAARVFNFGPASDRVENDITMPMPFVQGMVRVGGLGWTVLLDVAQRPHALKQIAVLRRDVGRWLLTLRGRGPGLQEAVELARHVGAAGRQFR